MVFLYQVFVYHSALLSPQAFQAAWILMRKRMRRMRKQVGFSFTPVSYSLPTQVLKSGSSCLERHLAAGRTRGSWQRCCTCWRGCRDRAVQEPENKQVKKDRWSIFWWPAPLDGGDHSGKTEQILSYKALLNNAVVLFLPVVISMVVK